MAPKFIGAAQNRRAALFKYSKVIRYQMSNDKIGHDIGDSLVIGPWKKWIDRLRNKGSALALVIFAICPFDHAAEARSVEWKEVVQLSDGRKIIVSQLHQYEHTYDGTGTSDLTRETTLTFSLPEFSSPIVWQERLHPLVLNIHLGRLYLVGMPYTFREFLFYGNPKPNYVGFSFFNGKWKRINFEDLPYEIYESNLWVQNTPPIGRSPLSLREKAEMRNRFGVDEDVKKINPRNKGFS